MQIPFPSLLVISCLLFGCSTANSHSSPQLESVTTPSKQSESLGQVLPIEAQVIMGGEIIELEVTRTPEQQALGLMYRENLPANRGMLFSFETPKVARFWMKNVPIALDMVFLLDGEIQAIRADVPPCLEEPCSTYGPPMRVNQVIELRSGRAAELGLKAGDRVTIEFVNSD